MESDLLKNNVDLSGLNQTLKAVRAEIRKILVGQPEMVDQLLAALLANGHVLIEGVPGVAKTLTARLLARSIDVDFSRIQFTPDLMPSDILGTSIFDDRQSDFRFKQGPIFSNMVLIDEINRAPAKTQAALFEVMEERQITVDGTTYPMSDPFMVLATQNPIEHEGTYRLPEAQLDRFLFKIVVDYPSEQEEVTLLTEMHERKGVNDLGGIARVLKGSTLADLRATVSGIQVAPNLIQYIARIVGDTRESPDIYVGGSPRASVALLASSKAFAAMDGRDYVSPDDIKTAVVPVLRHRIILTPEKEMEGDSSADVLNRIVGRIEVPR